MTDFELIVVDDGSTDGSLEWLRSQTEQIVLLSQTNRGPGAARNLGAKEATGEFLAFLDSDDLWFPWTLQTYQSVIHGNGNPSFIAGKPFRFGEDKAAANARSSPTRVNAFRDYLASGSEWRWWGASSFVIRRDAFLACGGFTDEWVNGEDADLALRLGIAPGFVQIIEPFTFAYREHEVSAMKSLPKTLAGARLQVKAELAGCYPGGETRSRERQHILARQIRPVTFDCLKKGLRNDAWQLYQATFAWNLALGRWKYLLGFLCKSLFNQQG